MWEILLYMCCFLLVNKEAFSVNGLTKYSQDERDIYIKRVGGVRDAMEPPEKEDTSRQLFGTLLVGHEPHGKI